MMKTAFTEVKFKISSVYFEKFLTIQKRDGLPLFEK